MVSSAQRWWLSCGRLEKTPQGASSYPDTFSALVEKAPPHRSGKDAGLHIARILDDALQQLFEHKAKRRQPIVPIGAIDRLQ